ncbi:hypothetical protein U1Q18_010668 [Sarracenia purpurea var. burkii]
MKNKEPKISASATSTANPSPSYTIEPKLAPYSDPSSSSTVPPSYVIHLVFAGLVSLVGTLSGEIVSDFFSAWMTALLRGGVRELHVDAPINGPDH